MKLIPPTEVTDSRQYSGAMCKHKIVKMQITSVKIDFWQNIIY